MPTGAGARGSNGLPSDQGKTEASRARMLSEMSHMARSLRRKLGRKGMVLRSEAGLASSLGGAALP